MSSVTLPCAPITDRRAVQSLASLCTIQTHLLEDGPLHGALELICRFALDLTGADTSVVGIPSDRDQALEVSTTSTRVRAARPAETSPGSDQGPLTFEIDNVIHDVLETRAPAVLAAWSPGFSHDRLCNEPAPSMILPLGARSKRFGVLMLRRTPRDVPFASDDLHVVMSFVERALGAVDVERQRRRVHQQSILEDRQRIACDLHDVVVHRLYAAGARLQATSNAVSSWRDGVDIQSSVGQIDTAIAELRSAIHDLGHPDGNQFDRFTGDWRRGNQTPPLPESNGHSIRRPSSSDSAQLLAPLGSK